MLDALLIVVMQFVLVPLTTLRTIFLVKSEIRNASLLGGVEALIYVISLGIIFSDLSNYLNMFAYAIGYSGGIILGGYIEKKLAIGYRTVNVSLLEKTPEVRKRYRLDIVVKRSREKELMALLNEDAPKAFVVSYEPTGFKGGYIVKSMKKAIANKNESN